MPWVLIFATYTSSINLLLHEVIEIHILITSHLFTNYIFVLKIMIEKEQSFTSYRKPKIYFFDYHSFLS